MTETIIITDIINHGSVIQILGTGTGGRVRSVVGDHRMILHAIEGLGLDIGVEVGVGEGDEGPFLCEPGAFELDLEEALG